VKGGNLCGDYELIEIKKTKYELDLFSCEYYTESF
jgi:hypothetical protein